MPTYEFHCPSCNTVVDKVKSISNRNSEEVCENCGHVMNRVPTACTFILRGSGWYTTDYKNTSVGGKKKGKDD